MKMVMLFDWALHLSTKNVVVRKLTAQMLEEHGACDTQVGMFKEEWPNGVYLTPKALALYGSGYEVIWLVARLDEEWMGGKSEDWRKDVYWTMLDAGFSERNAAAIAIGFPRGRLAELVWRTLNTYRGEHVVWSYVPCDRVTWAERWLFKAMKWVVCMGRK